jgi:ATP-dependent Clp protease ATP-binding subunit ClpA
MFERFTEKAVKVVLLAQEESRKLGHNFVGTEQILLGLIGEGTGVGSQVLKRMGVNLLMRVLRSKKLSDVAQASLPLRYRLHHVRSVF